MSPGIILLFVLAATFALCGVLHLLAWRRDRIARERLWFGLAAMAAAGAIGVYGIFPDLDNPSSAALRASMGFSMAWGMAMVWFSAEYSGAGPTTRRMSWLVTVLFALALVEALASPWPVGVQASSDPGHRQGLPGDLALFGLALLVAAGSVRLWRSRSRLRALTLGAGMGLAIFEMAGYATLIELDIARLPTAVPHVFMLMVLLVSYELAFSLETTQSMTERRQQGLAHISRLAVVGELTASIAHEINQPLGAILSNTEAGELLLERNAPPMDELGQILQDIRRDGLRATNVIQQVRTLVRSQEVVLEKLDANAVAEDVIGLVAPEARRRRITLDLLLAAEPVHVRGDRGRLEQVLINLLINALDAMDMDPPRDPLPGAPAEVVLAVSRNATNETEFRITDQGHGIPPEHLDRLFDSFYTSKAHGMGLGLSIARSLVELHGGWIHAENNPHGGATFRVTLPAFQERQGSP